MKRELENRLQIIETWKQAVDHIGCYSEMEYNGMEIDMENCCVIMDIYDDTEDYWWTQRFYFEESKRGRKTMKKFISAFLYGNVLEELEKKNAELRKYLWESEKKGE